MPSEVPGRVAWAVLFPALLVLLAACSSSGTGAPVASTAPPPAPTTAAGLLGDTSNVPDAYKAVYAAIARQVEDLAAMAGAAPPASQTVIGAELLSANANIGPRLLLPQAITAVSTELDALQSLGVQGVVVAVSFPLLLDSTPDGQGYLEFYKRVAAEVRARNMVLAVEANPVFVGSEVTPFTFSFAGLTVDSYAAQQRQMAQVIIDNLRPDYLSLIAEPETNSNLLHLNLTAPDTLVRLVAQELDGLRRGSTKVGAGVGTWSNVALAQALLSQTSIDFLDVHSYAMASQDLANLVKLVDAAKKANRTLVMTETWLYKDYVNGNFDLQGRIRANASGPAAEQKVVSYDFWEPLDAAYVAAMVRYVRANGFAFAAFFEVSRTGFAYLKWTPEVEAATYQAVSQQYSQLVSAGLRQKTPTRTGAALRDAIRGN